MRQPVSKEKLKKLYYYYMGIKEAFNAGILDGKIVTLMNKKCAELGVSFSTWRRRKNSIKP